MYTASITRNSPSCLIFVIDQSGSMDEVVEKGEVSPLAQPRMVDGKTFTHVSTGRSKAQAVSDAINRLILNLSIKCTKNEGIRDYYYVAVIGYGGAGVASAFGGLLAGRDLVPISELTNNPIRVEERTRKIDDGAGGLTTRTIKLPIWFEPLCMGGTPMCGALQKARDLASQFVQQHPDCFPPTVIHITDGESTDGAPTAELAGLSAVQSSDGATLVFNLHLTASGDDPVSFPNSAAGLPAHSKILFEGSSALTESMLGTANRDHELGLGAGARGFVLNGDMALIIQALDIGTRADNLR